MARVGNADDGAPIAAFDLAPEFRGAAAGQSDRSTSTTATRDYHTFEITGTKRMSNRWSLLASYGWTKSFEQRRHASRATRSAATRCRLNPNDMINTDDGRPVRVHALDRQAERHLELAVVGYLDLAAGALPAGRPVRPHLRRRR